jgi:hypothetical protein
MNNKKDPRSAAPLSSKLDNRLAAYMAAAAGVSLLASPFAEAKVVYTATNVLLQTGSIPIDLNNDGITDFVLGFHELDKSLILAIAPQVAGNAIRLGPGGAAAGFFGVPVGPGEKFGTNTLYSWGVFMADAGSYSLTWFFGPWANTTNRYLGLKFVINGQVHYGWARLTVPLQFRNAVMTGYAYETTPNTNIIEGHLSGADAASNFAPSDLFAPATQPASLGLLARGAVGLVAWRREDDAVAQ